MNRFINKNIFPFITSLLILLGYYVFIPYTSKVNWLQKHDYNLTLKNIKNNAPAVFKKESMGKYYIHPGDKYPVIATFTLLDSMSLKFTFSLKKGAKEGNIKFTINKNGEFYKRVIVKSGKDVNQSIEISIGKNGTIDILADNHGSLAYDWGTLSIENMTVIDRFKNNIFPLLWVLLFLYLFKKGFGYSVIITYILFVLTMYAEKLNFGAYEFTTIVSYSIVYFLFTFLVVLLYQWFYRFWVTFVFMMLMTSVVLVVPMVFIGYIHIFGTVVNEDILFAVFQTHTNEVIEFMSTFIALKYIVYLAFIVGVIAMLHYFQSKKSTLKIDSILGIFIVLSLFIVTMVQIEEMRIPKLITTSYVKYIDEIRLFTEEKKRRKTSKISFSASKKKKGETYVVVIGESLNKNHMGLYGYLRSTTPHLSRMNKNNNLILFHNIYSNHTVTTYALSFALTEANQYNKLKYYNAISIIELLNKANFETYWVTAQKTYGRFQNSVSIIATEADEVITADVHGIEQGLDGSLIHKVKKILKKQSEKNRVIFVHLQGSHYAYTSRYPSDKYSIYKGPLNPGVFGTEAHSNKLVNSYDNSIVYNDYVVSSLLNILHKQKGVRGFIYMPDHAEDVMGEKAHNPTLFTYAMTQIPMIAWFSNTYIDTYSDTYKVFKSNINTLFSNDMLYDTLIGLMHIKTEKYNTQFDLSSSHYKLEENDSLVLHSAKKYTDKNNSIYWQQYNIQYLSDNNILSKVVPCGVNSIGMLNEVSKSGYHTYHIDIIYDEKNKKFIMGSVSQSRGVSFEEYVKSISKGKRHSFWITIRDINITNYKSILKRLKVLDSTFNFKDNTTLNLNNKNKFIQTFMEEGWNISYDIDSKNILKYLNEGSEKMVEKIVIQIIKELKNLNVTILSFKKEIYPFINEYLEDRIKKDISYHIDNSKLDLKNKQFIEELNTSHLLFNQRIKSLCVDYTSVYKL